MKTKNLLRSISLALIPWAAFSQSMFGPIDVADNLGNYHPQIEIAGDGTPLVLWTDGGQRDLYLARFNGNQFGTPIQLDPSGINVQNYDWSGADLDVDGDNVYVVFRSRPYEGGHVYLVKSTDNGLSFGDTLRIDDLSEGFGQYPDVVAMNDTVYITFMAHNASGHDPQYVVVHSYDGGATFSTAVDAGALLNAEACDCCQPEIVANSDYVVVLLRNNDQNVRDIKGIISTDHGQNFNSVLNIDNHQWTIAGCPSTGPDGRLLDNETLLSAYKSYSGGVGKLYLSEFDLTNDSLIYEVDLTNAGGTFANYPQIHFDQNYRAVVYEGIDNGTDVYLNVWQGDLQNLDTAHSINLTQTQGAQKRADVALNNGKAHFVFMDSNSGNVKYGWVGAAIGVQENEIRFESYPNPVHSYLHVTAPHGSSVTIYDATAKKLLHVRTQNTTTDMDLSGLENGIYIIEVADDLGNASRNKFMIQK
jgi:hypothetical protein